MILKNNFLGFDLDGVEGILKVGLFGIGFFMLLFSFWLIRRKEKFFHIILYMLFSIFILICALSWKIIENPKLLEVFFNNKKVAVEADKSENLKTLDLNVYDADSYRGFAYKRPKDGWTKPVQYEGLSGMISLNFTGKDSATVYSNLLSSMQGSPLKEMILNQHLVVTEKNDSKFEVTLTDSTTNKWIEFDLDNRKRIEINNRGLDTTKSHDLVGLKNAILDYKRLKYLIPKNIVFANRFAITVLEKKYLPVFLRGMSIYDLLRFHISHIYSISEIKTQKNSILINGIASQFQNVVINGRVSELKFEKVILLRSTQSFFYIVEISYSPQSNGFSDVLKEQTELISDFVTLENAD